MCRLGHFWYLVLNYQIALLSFKKMAKLDAHADLIKRHYNECRNAQDTYERLLVEGIETCYESVRTWLRKHADELPPLRSGAGKPKSAKPEQLFGCIPKNAEWAPRDQIYPGLFVIFTDRATPEAKDALLYSCLKMFGVEISVDRIEEAELQLKRFRCLGDLEIYFLAYLLGHHGALVGVAEEKFAALTRAITPMASRLREIIMRRNSISVGELRKRIRRP
jgi:hypothetical protein